MFKLPAVEPRLIRRAWVRSSGRRVAPVRVRKVRRAARRGVLKMRLAKVRWRRAPKVRSKGLTVRGTWRGGTRKARAAGKGGGPKLVISVKRPRVSITSAPSGSTEATSAQIGFEASHADSVTCALDGGAAAPCGSPATFDGLAAGVHTVVVRATNTAGTASDSASWEVVAPAAEDPASAPAPTPETEPAPSTSPTGTADAGSVNFVKAAESDFDVFTKAPTVEQQTWMRDHYHRMRAYAPYFDSRLSWFPNAWFYQDLYAIYRGQSVAAEHPEWILKDAQGNPLYIPFGCSGGVCPQYAGDFGNPDFRRFWIEQAKTHMSKGYVGIFVDDVNMDWRVGDGTGAHVKPIDPRTGQTMTLADWRRYMAEMVEQIRAAFPDKEIVHNAIWYAGCGATPDTCWSDPYIQRQLLAADVIELERGINDGGITGGTGTFGIETFFARVDWLHSKGKSVVYDSKAGTDTAREYGLAGYFLTSNGHDGLGNDPGGTPTDWWAGYDVSLGAPKGERYAWNGVLRRDFERGFVLLNKPGAPTATLSLGGTYAGPTGGTRTSVTLAGAQGAVLVQP